VHAPDHPEKLAGAVAVSLSVTAVFGGKVAVHSGADPVAQLIPAGLLVIVPLPLPDGVTVNASPEVNVAETFSAAATVMLHVDVPEQAPLQPPK